MTADEIRAAIIEDNTLPSTGEMARDEDFWQAETAAQLAELNDNLNALGDLFAGTGVVDKLRELVEGLEPSAEAAGLAVRRVHFRLDDLRKSATPFSIAGFRCSGCNGDFVTDMGAPNHCPHCGARFTRELPYGEGGQS